MFEAVTVVWLSVRLCLGFVVSRNKWFECINFMNFDGKSGKISVVQNFIALTSHKKDFILENVLNVACFMWTSWCKSWLANLFKVFSIFIYWQFELILWRKSLKFTDIFVLSKLLAPSLERLNSENRI